MRYITILVWLFFSLAVYANNSGCRYTSCRPGHCDFTWCRSEQEAGFYEVKMIEGQQQFGAACLDGSPPSYYFRPGFVDINANNDGTDKFFIYFEGGGWCAGLSQPMVPSMDTCLHRSQGTLGSTLYDMPYLFTDAGYFSTDKTINSVMYNWNSVYMRYCDGTSYSSNLDEPVPVNGVNLYFRGFRNVKALLEDLMNKYNFSESTQVVIGGCSAGGLASYLHVQYMYDVLSQKNKNLQYFAALPDSGFFLEYETSTQKYVTGMQWVFKNGNCTSGVNQNCIQAHTKTNDTWKCIFAQETAPYIDVPVFALQSRFDSWQLTNILGNTNNNTLVNEYGNTFTKTFNQTFLQTNKNLHGGLLDSCYHHCGEWDQIVVNGLDSTEMFYNMFYHKSQSIFWFQNQPYPCKACCTP